MPNQQPPDDPRTRAESAFVASQQRDTIKQEIAREREKVDAKTAKLRALRLAKEAAAREAGVAIVPEVRDRRVRMKKS